MTQKVTLYHVNDGAVEMFTCHAAEALKHDREWSAEPWDKDQADNPPAPIQAGVGRKKSRKNDD
jgi:hypothetical protein